MTSRVPRHVAKELIQFIKKIDIKANFWDPRAKSAFEFSRQMSSPKLKKINPTFATELTMLTNNEPFQEPVLEAEFLDGSKLSISCLEKTSADLRSLVFTRAGEAEEAAEISGGGPDASKGGAGKGGAKPDSKGAAKGGKK